MGSAAPRQHDRPIIKLEAPAGYGKTSLLSQWRRVWLSGGAVVAWLSLDEYDDPARFTQAIALAMERASGRAAFGRIRQREMAAQVDFDRLTEWLSEVADLGAESVLILDEAERLPEETVQQSLNYILSNLPANLCVVLASRRRLKLRLSDLVAHGQVAQITSDALSFSLAETIAVLQAHFGTRLDADAAARLHELTHGWPLGLQLAVATMEKGRDAREIIKGVSAQTGDLQRYFIEWFVARLPADKSEFLICISVLDRLHAQLCEALSGRADSGKLLEELRETTPILSDGVDSDWWTIHPLARDFLRKQFDGLPATQKRAVHAAACTWLAEHGLEEEAARHALKAGQRQRAWALAEKSLFDALIRGQVGRVREWFERAPIPKQQQRPELLLTAGWSCALSSRYAEAELLAQRVLRDRRSGPPERFYACLMLSAAAIYADQVDRAQILVQQWRHDMPPPSEGREGLNGANQLAWLALFQGNPLEARRLLQRSRAAAAESEFTLIDAFREAIDGMIYLWEGEALLALRTLSRAHSRAEAIAGRRGVLAVTLAGLLALALSECADWENAGIVLANRLDAIEHLATPSVLIAGYIAAARVAVSHGEEGRGCEILEELSAIAEVRDLPRAHAAALAEMIRLNSLRGRGETCAVLLARLEALFNAGHPATTGIFGELLQLNRSMAIAYTAVAQNAWSDALEALGTAAPLAEKLQRRGDVLEIKLLQAFALHAGGRDGVTLFKELVAPLQALGLKRLAAERPFLELQNVARSDGNAQDRHTDEIDVNVGRVETFAASAPKVVPTPLLTPKEREILGLLAQRLSNKQIATALDVGNATIKWHLKNVFSKLNAGAREHAIHRARMLGIIEMH